MPQHIATIITNITSLDDTTLEALASSMVRRTGAGEYHDWQPGDVVTFERVSLEWDTVGQTLAELPTTLAKVRS